MIKKIFLFFILITSSLASFIMLNLAGIMEIMDLFLFRRINIMFLASILLLCLIAFLFSSRYFYLKYKNNNEKGGLISFGIYIVILTILYFLFFKDYTEYEKIEESYFKTYLQDIEVSEEENGLAVLSKISKGFIIYQDDHLYKLYGKSMECLLSSSNSLTCDLSEEKNNLKQNNFFDIEWISKVDKLNEELKIISEKKYFKQGYGSNKYAYQGLSSYYKNRFYSVLYKFENGRNQQGLDIIFINHALAEKLLIGDTGLIGYIIGKNLLNDSIKQFKYILDNYQLTKFELEQINKLFSKNIDIDSAYSNAIKYEYNEYTRKLEYRLFSKIYYDNLFFNKEKFNNILSNIYLKTIEGEFTKEDMMSYYITYNNGKDSLIMKQIIFVYNPGTLDHRYKKDAQDVIEQRDKLALKVKNMIGSKDGSTFKSVLLK